MYENVYAVNNNIKVEFNDGIIAVLCNEQLIMIVTKLPATATDELVSAIKKVYLKNFNKDFMVNDKSLAIEIWGHVFAEQFSVALTRIIKLRIVQKLAEKIYKRSVVINIGEKKHDSNRFFWDMLAPLKPAIGTLLLKRK